MNLYQATIQATGIDPRAPFQFPPITPLAAYGHKARRRLSKETNKVLWQAGFGQTPSEVAQ